MAKHNIIGKIGENVAEKYLKSKSFYILKRNFNVRAGEIDIIASKNLKSEQELKKDIKEKDIYFIEVKTKEIMSFKNLNDMSFIPENNITRNKKQRMLRAIKIYLNFNSLKETEIEINLWAIMVYLHENTKQAKIKIYKNIDLNNK